MDLRPINPYYHRTVIRTFMLYAVSAAASESEEYTYPYEWIEPVTDRTAEDVEYAKKLLATDWQHMTKGQQKEYLSGLKGCLNRADLERIETDIQILIDVLELKQGSSIGNIPEFPTTKYFQKLQENAASIRGGYYIHNDTPAVPELPYNTWDKYNDIEKILADVYEVVSAQFNYYAGEIYAGDETGLLL